MIKPDELGFKSSFIVYKQIANQISIEIIRTNHEILDVCLKVGILSYRAKEITQV